MSQTGHLAAALGCSAVVLALLGRWLSRKLGATDGDGAIASAKGEEEDAVCLVPSLGKELLANIAATAALVAAKRSSFGP